MATLYYILYTVKFFKQQQQFTHTEWQKVLLEEGSAGGREEGIRGEARAGQGWWEQAEAVGRWEGSKVHGGDEAWKQHKWQQAAHEPKQAGGLIF